jgi:hypothetical protein
VAVGILVMAVIVSVSVAVTVSVTVIMIVIVIVIVIVIMRMPMTTRRIASGFRFERPFLHLHRKAQLVHQAVEHVIVLVGQPARRELQRYVTISQMIGGAREQVRIAGFDDRKLFGSRPNFDDQIAVLGGQPITMFERQPPFEQESHFAPAIESRA